MAQQYQNIQQPVQPEDSGIRPNENEEEARPRPNENDEEAGVGLNEDEDEAGSSRLPSEAPPSYAP
jgi:hypothetical protein